ncbi:MAG: aminotransferase class V-fold PLP-dependent enzyme [Hyphomicrobiales bacterium]
MGRSTDPIKTTTLEGGSEMLSCQRELFAIERDIAYLNAASYSPLPLSVRAAGERGVADKVRPWRRDPEEANRVVEETRQAAAGLIGASADDIAVVGAASYGVATACANLGVAPGSRILLLEGEHSSLMLGFKSHAGATGARLDIVPRPADGDWTSAVLERIEQAGAPPLGMAALTPVHWTDGSILDLSRIAPELRRRGAAFMIDATQTASVMPLDVALLQPDYLVFPAYKWLLGPYGIAFLYVAPSRQTGRPLEEHAFNRKGYDSASRMPVAELPFLDGARRFDRGERDSFITIPMAHAGLRLIGEWGVERIAARLRMLTDLLAERLTALGITVPPRHLRSPHILGFRLPGGRTAQAAREMENAGIFASVRQEFLRLSPHVYNDEEDVGRFIDWARDRARN